jgi:hypothetical protein
MFFVLCDGMKGRGAMIKLPVVIGLVVCEHAIVEERTRDLSLINCFTYRKVKSFPTLPLKMAAVAFLVDGLGEGDLDLNILQLSTDKEIFRMRRRISIDDSLNVARLIIRFAGLVFPSEGGYEVSLRVDKEPFAHRTINIIQ